MNLLDSFSMGADLSSSLGNISGVASGIVTNNKDVENLGRIRVKFPWLTDAEESFIARLSVPMAGAGTGTYFVPSVGDEVLCAFEHGDINRPYVIGSLWNGKDKPPQKNTDGKNNIREIKSRSGHSIIFDDTSGAEKIQIKDKSGNNKITLNTKTNAVEIESTNNVSIKSSSGNVTIEGQSVEIKSTGDLNINSEGDTNIESSGEMRLTGSTIDLN